MDDNDETPDVSPEQESVPERLLRHMKELKAGREEFPSTEAYRDALIKSAAQDGLTIEDLMAGMEELSDISDALQRGIAFDLAKRGRKHSK
jgi:hypothetical protein